MLSVVAKEGTARADPREPMLPAMETAKASPPSEESGLLAKRARTYIEAAALGCCSVAVLRTSRSMRLHSSPTHPHMPFLPVTSRTTLC